MVQRICLMCSVLVVVYVRGVLSPSLFNVFRNIVLTRLRTLGVGCWVQQLYVGIVGCLLYADDIILLCPTLTGLQLMLDSCCATAVELNLQFNAKKSHCIALVN